MLNINFKEHNENAKKLWKAFIAGKHSRVPMMIFCNARYLILNPELNKKRVTYKEYFENPDVMLETQIDFRHWFKHNIIQDSELGLPEKGWNVEVDLQNVYEAAWLGCPIKYFDNQVPDTELILNDDNKNMLFDKGIPDPFSGIMSINQKYYEYLLDKKKNAQFYNRPLNSISPAALGTDGPFTVAANVRGATSLFLDIFDDPKYVHKLLSFITEATIIRLRAWWKYSGSSNRTNGFCFADDSIANLSVTQYTEFVLPYHKRLISELNGQGNNMIHLCGNSSHLFNILKKELDVYEFDTGFPIDHGAVRKSLGKDVRIWGGPSAQLLRFGSYDEVYKETKNILTSGILEGGNFVLREGNNLAPFTPSENVQAMYSSVQEYGKIEGNCKFNYTHPLAEKLVSFIF